VTFVLVSPAGEQRVNGRAALFRVLDAMGEDERAAVVVRSGGEQQRGSVVYVTLSYQYERDEQ
jgi:hypothetical protein